MLWEEETKKEDYVVPENVVDLSFKIECKQLPVSHASELYQALHELLPWLPEEPAAGHTPDPRRHFRQWLGAPGG